MNRLTPCSTIFAAALRSAATLVALFFAAVAVSAQAAAAGVEVIEQPDRVRIEVNGQLFTEYRFAGSARPYYWPLLGPDGVKMTRSTPIEKIPGESNDHPHHRSLFFGHGNVNGANYWTLGGSTDGKSPTTGTRVEHVKILEAKGGPEVGVLSTAQKWFASDNTALMTSIQTLRVHTRPENERMFDYEITLTAGDKDAVFKDDKEGTFAVRIADSMRLKQPKDQPGGQIVNSEGLSGGAVWGKKAKWVDMSGPIDGKTYGIAIFDHPTNLRHPTRWHARDYGLFAVNPFCENAMDQKQPQGAGDYTLKAGASLTLKYRLLLHRGDAAAAKLAEHFEAFAK